MANARRLRVVYDVSMVLFEGFELLDVFGPVELLARLPEEYRIIYVAPDTGPVRSSQGAEIVVPVSLKDAAHSDIVFMPGPRPTIPSDAQPRGSPRFDRRLGVHRFSGSGGRWFVERIPGHLQQTSLRLGVRTRGRGHMGTQGAVDTRPEPLDLLRGGSRHGHDGRVDRSPHGPGSRSDGRP